MTKILFRGGGDRHQSANMSKVGTTPESSEILVWFQPFSQIKTLFYVEFFNQESNDKGKDFLDS